MKKLGLAIISAVLLGQPAVAQLDYQVMGGTHQPAVGNVEKANIIVIRCADGREFYIYSYFRPSGPNYRAIEPPHWGSPIGGMDHMTYEDAVHVACYT